MENSHKWLWLESQFFGLFKTLSAIFSVINMYLTLHYVDYKISLIWIMFPGLENIMCNTIIFCE